MVQFQNTTTKGSTVFWLGFWVNINALKLHKNSTVLWHFFLSRQKDLLRFGIYGLTYFVIRMASNVAYWCTTDCWCQITWNPLFAKYRVTVFWHCTAEMASAVAKNSTKVVRLASKASIFKVELYAITLAMDFVRHSKDTKFIVFSDSMSKLEGLNGFKIEVDLVLIKEYTSLTKAGKVIEFCCIPSHVNIAGNERADTASKAALYLPVTSMKLPASEFKPCVSRFCFE